MNPVLIQLIFQEVFNDHNKVGTADQARNDHQTVEALKTNII